MASRWAKPDRAGARPASLVCDPVRTTQVLKNSRIGRRPLGFLDSWILACSHLSDINQPAFRRDRDRLSSANCIQLFQNNLHVAFHRVLTDVKDLTDFFIALAETHLLENLKLPLGELRLRHGVCELRGDVMR